MFVRGLLEAGFHLSGFVIYKQIFSKTIATILLVIPNARSRAAHHSLSNSLYSLTSLGKLLMTSTEFLEYNSLVLVLVLAHRGGGGGMQEFVVEVSEQK